MTYAFTDIIALISIIIMACCIVSTIINASKSFILWIIRKHINKLWKELEYGEDDLL